ncbi:MAG: 3-dehydroquinate synthase family protein [Termitinemataceae bacterium]|nr:MAG: 3-dehydroquinate synthase family protein [Termitinemataceae bacterium]
MKKTFFLKTGKSTIHIQEQVPCIKELCDIMCTKPENIMFVCDENTKFIVQEILQDTHCAICVIKSGEQYKNWETCENILHAAKTSGLSRDAVFAGVGGGVITDLTAFCASIYMRGVACVLVSTTLLGMVDASFGGKTGFDLFGIKNCVGTFYPAQCVFISTSVLKTLPQAEWKSGMAELIKTAVLDNSIYNQKVHEQLLSAGRGFTFCNNPQQLIAASILFKAKIVLSDPKETKGKRALLNLGHTFGHALEASAGLGVISHGEAVAWGIARACELGTMLAITPEKNANIICNLLKVCNYEISALHCALATKKNDFFNALYSDKKKIGGILNFILPAKRGAIIYPLARDQKQLIQNIVGGT